MVSLRAIPFRHISMKTLPKKTLQDLLTYSSAQQRANVAKSPAVLAECLQVHSEGIRSFAIDETDLPLPLPEEGDIRWYHLVGITDAGQLQQLLANFLVHDLVIEDMTNTKQRPKFEEYGHYLFVVTTVFNASGKSVGSDHIFLIVGKNYIITVQRKPLGLFSSLKKRLPENLERIQEFGVAFLAYIMLDRIVDDYFVAVEDLLARGEKLDQKLFSGQDSDILPRIHRLKHDSIKIRRTLTPIRDGIAQIMRSEYTRFPDALNVFFRDTLDHCLQLSESLESVHYSVQSMMDIHLSFQSNALNKQMRVLTSITIIFMPMTLLTGIYGMNFDHMPELHWKYGYFALLAFMAVLAAVLVRIFKRRHWL